MIICTTSLKLDYEPTRLSRYGDTLQNVKYTPEELLKAYGKWAYAPYGREHFWDSYCDVRDCVPWGTNAKIRRARALH